MLSYGQLEKCTHSYRRGYRSGYEGGARRDEKGPSEFGDRPFAEYDFEEGYKAGRNDAYWDSIPYATRRDPSMRDEILRNRPRD